MTEEPGTYIRTRNASSLSSAGKPDRMQSSCNHMQKNETKPLSHVVHKNQFKWIIDLDIRPETIKCIEENMGKTLHSIYFRNIFVDLSLAARKTKKNINKWEYIKL